MREICDVCSVKPAKNHLCEIIDGQTTSLDLCHDCLRARQAASGFELPLLDGTQRCYYCDGPAQCGGMNLEWEQSVRGNRFHFTCFRCAGLYRHFLAEALERIPKELSAGEKLEAIEHAISESDKRVHDSLEDTKS